MSKPCQEVTIKRFSKRSGVETETILYANLRAQLQSALDHASPSVLPNALLLTETIFTYHWLGEPP